MVGIRINKAIGYGLVDLAVNEAGKLVDPRINPESPLLTYGLDCTLNAFLAWLDGRDDRDAKFEAAAIRGVADQVPDYRLQPDRAVRYNNEYGLPNVLYLRPVWMDDWHRHDDSIDWIEETYFGPNPDDQIQPRVDVLPHGIYPYNGYVDTRNGKRLGSSVMAWIRANSNDRADWLRDGLAGGIRYRGEEEGDPVFIDHADAARHVAPRVPEGVALLAEWGGLFTDPAVIHQLRPMRYVWWS